MPLYSISQLLGKTIVLTKGTPVYNVSDVNTLGWQAKSRALGANTSVVIDSYLLAGPAYTNPIYGLQYAERKDDYLTFYNSLGTYQAVKIGDVGKQSDVLTSQGVLNAQQEAEQKKLDAMNPLERFLYQLGKSLGSGLHVLIIIAVVIAIVVYVVPVAIRQYKQK